MRRSLLLPLLPLVLLLAACGSSTSGGGPAPDRAPRKAPASTALTVGGTDLRLGGAQADDGSGATDLAGPSRPDPARLKRRGRRRDGVGAGAGCADQDIQPADGNLDRVVASTLCLLNGERADAGLGPLASNDDLASAAIEHSRDMVAKGYFSHDAPGGSSSTDRIRATGYIPTDKAWTVGENLAWGTGTLATPKNIVIAWMNSPGHRENILRPAFDEIGFGVVVGNPRAGDGLGATYTTTFGSLGSSRSTATTPVKGADQAAPPVVAQANAKVKGTAKSSKRRAKARRLKAAKRRAAKKRAKAARAAKATRAAHRR